MKGKFTLLMLLAMSSATMFAQSSDNQDEVVKIDQHNHNAFREGEIIVKINSSSAARVRARGGAVTSGVKALDRVLDEIGAFECEELMPLTGSKNAGKRVQMFNGNSMTVPNTEKTYLLKFDASKVKSVEQAIEKVKALDDVQYAEPNYMVFALGNDEPTVSSIWNDPLGTEQWGLEALNLHKMHGKPNVSVKRPVIAILDTGIDIAHPDLEDNIWTNELESTGESNADDDTNGFVDDIHGWDFVNQTARIRDNNGHGTHCAGIAAAVANNGKGMVGANYDAYIMPVTVMQSDGTGDIATIIKGLDYAAANGADIISMSLGTYATSVTFEQALGKAYATAVLVAAAGNDGHTIETSEHCISCKFYGGTPCFPAAYSFVLGVESSINPQGTLAGYSNWDNTGHLYSGWGEDKLYNYELRAPGSNILSTYLGGKYKSLNGTSMACPFAAGAISRLLQVKEYENKDILFGDLIHASGNGNLDVLAAYFIKDEDRRPTLQLITYTIDDTEFGDGDGRLDAGETVDIYPVLKNYWGKAKNITCSITLAENEDPEIVTILNNNVDFGSELISYAKNKSANPLRIKVNDNCVDGRHICLVLGATCSNITDDVSQDVVMTAENGVEIGGILEGNTTLHPGVNYIVTSMLAVPKGSTLTIEPGTVIKFKNSTGFRCEGKIVANGTIDNRIVFTKADLHNSSITGFLTRYEDTISYAVFEDLRIEPVNYSNEGFRGVLIDCIFKNIYSNTYIFPARLIRCNIYNLMCEGAGLQGEYESCNLINSNLAYNTTMTHSNASYFINSNLFSNTTGRNNDVIDRFNAIYYSTTIQVLKQENPNYYGSANNTILRNNIMDMNHPTKPIGYGTIDLNYILRRPSAEAHGIVWKVVVNGFDSQDEFEQLSPLGVGRHKFEVYFNRAMDISVAPTISMGVRKPYTQVAIAEDGTWSADSTVYTAYVTITGKTASDGLNRIYVYGAQDNEYFEIPEENSRFNVNVQAAGSMATGLVAEAGLGKVSLNWETIETNFDDLLGFNVYRYTIDDQGVESEQIKINDILVEPGEVEDGKMEQGFIDYNVIPGTTYYYFVKEMSTDLSQNVISNAVACTPLTAEKGDANGSMHVDVADVVTEVNYLTGQNPQPFIFEAADVNSDDEVNILDVVGTVNIIIAPENPQSMTVDNTATFTIENGILYVESDVALGGVQVTLHAPRGTEFTTLEGLNDMERADAWIADDKYILLAYSMSGKTIGTGKQALLEIGSATISNVVASDVAGRNVLAIDGTSTGIEQLPFGFDDFVGAEVRYFDVMGRQVSHTEALGKGIYIMRMYINGKCVKTYKQLNK